MKGQAYPCPFFIGAHRPRQLPRSAVLDRRAASGSAAFLPAAVEIC